jgi:hypothetical protein
MASPDHAGSVARGGRDAAYPATTANSAAGAANTASLDAGSISARLDRLPATRSIWKLVVLLSLCACGIRGVNTGPSTFAVGPVGGETRILNPSLFPGIQAL